jgi:hypothetical protein
MEKNNENELNRDVKYLRLEYAAGIILWVVIIYALGLEQIETLAFLDIFFLSLPIALFIIAIVYIPKVLCRDWQNGGANVFTAGLLIALPLLTYIREHAVGHRLLFSRIMAVGLILSLLSLFDVWVESKNTCMVKHGKSILQTMAIAILAYGFYRFFVECPCE